MNEKIEIEPYCQDWKTCSYRRRTFESELVSAPEIARNRGMLTCSYLDSLSDKSAQRSCFHLHLINLLEKLVEKKK